MSDNCFSQRNYDHILEQLKEHTTQTLVFANFNEDFAKQITKQGNYIYCKGPQGDGDIYECLLFGDIASANNGTVNKASGNFYADEGKPITDSSKIKDVLVLQVPGLAPEKMVDIFQDQIATLNQIREADEQDEKETGEKVTFVKEALHSSSLDPSDLCNIIAVHLPDKFILNLHQKAIASRKKRGLFTEMETGSMKKEDVVMKELQTPAILTDDTIHLGTLYNPNLLPDHKGDFFKHTHAKLVQHDIRDCKGNLIPPWDMYSKLHQCMMVLVCATLHCWVIKDKDGRDKDGGGAKKIYQVLAKSVQVLGESDFEYKLPPVPILPQCKYTDTPLSSTTTPKKSAAAFNSFEISPSPTPAKKLKLSTHNTANSNAKASSSKS